MMIYSGTRALPQPDVHMALGMLTMLLIRSIIVGAACGVISGTVAPTPPCLAPSTCSCVSRGFGRTVADTVRHYFANAHIVARGVVISQVLTPNGQSWAELASGDSIPDGPIIATIRILRRWKGVVGDTIATTVSGSAAIVSSCELGLEVGGEFLLFFSRLPDGRLYTGYCSGTRRTFRNTAWITALDELASRR